MQLDHLAVTAADLAAGVAWAEARLGLPLAPGGRHALFSTHNRLLSLGPDLYLEVIAPDPEAPPPARPRWFDLDRAGAPLLGNWIVRLEGDEGFAPDAGEVLALSRGDLRWEIAVPADGRLPRDGGLPTPIRWAAGTVHPAARLPDHGARLVALTVFHPEAPALAARLRPVLRDPRVRFVAAVRAGLQARIATPAGIAVL